MSAPNPVSRLHSHRSTRRPSSASPRKNSRSLALHALLLGLALGGCGTVVPVDPDAGAGPDPGSDSGSSPVTLPLAASFEMVAGVTLDGSFPLPGLGLEEHRFILRLDDVDATSTAGIAGTSGQSVTASFARQSDGVRALSSGLSLTVDLLDGSTSCELGDMVYEQMQLTPVDDDGDGMADRVQGTASGRFELDSFTGVGPAFTATLEGSLDTTLPRLTIAGSQEEHHVLAPLRINASEPLPASTRLSILVEGSNSFDELTGDSNAPARTSFISASGMLPLGATLVIESDEPVRDLAGNENPAELPLAVQTMADPGLFAEDGFDGELIGDLRGSAAQVTSIGSMLPITGERSLLMEPGSRLTVVMPRAATDTSFALQARTLHQDEGHTKLSARIQIGVPGGTVPVAEQVLSSSNQPFDDTGDNVWLYAGEFRQIGGPLPTADEDVLAGDTVVLSIQLFGPRSTCLDNSPSEVGLLIDNLRLE